VGSKHILVIDDDAAVRLLLTKMLEQAGYRVSTAEEGQSGLEAAWADRPDLVITDMMMPVNDGFRTIRLFRADSTIDDIPLIIISGAVGRGDVQEVLETGAAAFFPKPVDAAALIAKIEELIGPANSA
jgi:CheY-like chemotaxis protein